MYDIIRGSPNAWDFEFSRLFGLFQGLNPGIKLGLARNTPYFWRKSPEMIKKIEHIGIAVKSLQSSNELFKKLFGKEHYKVEPVESEGVSTSFFMLGETKIELLEATTTDSAIARFIEKKGEGIHHIAYEVDNIYEEMERLKGEGFEVLNKEPKFGADNKMIFFLHPKSTNGVLVELCQERNEEIL